LTKDGRYGSRGKKKLHNNKLHNLYSSPDIFRTIKPGRMRCKGHVSGMGKTQKSLVGNPEEKKATRRT
jgi:hypothetical protein